MVVGDDQVDPQRSGPIGGIDRGHVAVDGNDNAAPHLLGALDAASLESVSVVDAVRHEVVDVGAKGTQRHQQHNRAGDSVDVVVAVDDDSLATADRDQQAVDGCFHLREFER